MNNGVPYTEVGDWLDEQYDDCHVRVWSDGDITFSMNASDMTGGNYTLKEEDLPGDWCIEGIVWAEHGVSMNLTRAINLDRGDDE